MLGFKPYRRICSALTQLLIELEVCGVRKALSLSDILQRRQFTCIVCNVLIIQHPVVVYQIFVTRFSAWLHRHPSISGRNSSLDITLLSVKTCIQQKLLINISYELIIENMAEEGNCQNNSNNSKSHLRSNAIQLHV